MWFCELSRIRGKGLVPLYTRVCAADASSRRMPLSAPFAASLLLRRHIDRPELHCRWSWTPGDLAIWDERSTVHQVVNDYFPQQRIVHRCVVDGNRPFFNQ